MNYATNFFHVKSLSISDFIVRENETQWVSRVSSIRCKLAPNIAHQIMYRLQTLCRISCHNEIRPGLNKSPDTGGGRHPGDEECLRAAVAGYSAA